MWALVAQAADPTNPVSYSPLAIVASVVAFLLWFTKGRVEDDRKSRAELEVKLDAAREEIAEQRSLKHRAINKLSAAEGTLHLVARLKADCSCGSLDALEPLLEPYREERRR